VNTKNRVKLRVCNSDIVISSDDSEQYIKDIAAKVELKIDSLKAHSSGISVTIAAIFAAMDFCDEAFKANSSADNLRTQIKEYLEDAAAARAELSEAQKQIISLNKKLNTNSD
jgi:cell division protein ZapA